MAEAKDPSTVATLHPARPRELHYKDFKNSLHLYGSQFMSLRRPSRLPESGREYAPGDPVNLVDWKAYARLGQLIVREVRDESTSRVVIGIDASETMHWPTPDVPQAVSATKVEVALRLGLHLAHVHLRMGDQVELWLCDEVGGKLPTKLLKPRRGDDLVAYFTHLVASAFAPAAIANAFTPAVYTQRTFDKAFWLGDGLGAADLGSVLRSARRSFFLHVLSSLELSTDWLDDGTSYLDQDQGRALQEYQGSVLKQGAGYEAQLAAWCKTWQQRQQDQGGDYLTISEVTPLRVYQAALEAFIKVAGRA